MSVGLVMVVKDEAHVLERCLRSVKSIIDSFVIVVDQRTTDRSEQVAEEALMGLPGTIVRKSWLGFSESRNAAVALSQADFWLAMDADDYLVLPFGYTLPSLDRDGYFVEINDGSYGSETVYPRLILLRRDIWHYEGVVHERLVGSDDVAPLDCVKYIRTQDGSSWSDPFTKAMRDAVSLEEEIRKNPDDTYATFYAAQSWRDIADLSDGDKRTKARNRAIAYYRRRTRMRGGYADEVFYSHFMMGKLLQRRDLQSEAIFSYHLAIEANPARAAEPRHDLVVLLREMGRHEEAYEIGLESLGAPQPMGIFVDTSIYKWRLELEWASAAWWAGHRAEAKLAFERLLRVAPPEEHVGLRKSLAFCAK